MMENTQDSTAVLCPKCTKLSSPASATKVSYLFTWCQTWKCTNEDCEFDDFYSCRDCFPNHARNPGARFLKQRASVLNHHKKKHLCLPPPAKQAKESNDCEGVSSSFNVDDDEEMNSSPSEPSSSFYQRDDQQSYSSSSSAHESQTIVKERLASYFERKESSIFYEHEREEKGKGYRRIIANALYPNQQKYIDLLREEDVDLHIDIALLLDNLPKQHQKRLFDVLHTSRTNGYLSHVTEDSMPVSSSTATSVSQSSSPFIARMPTFSEMGRVYIGRFSNISILSNLPHPKVKTIGSHAYIPLREALRDLFAYPHTQLDSPTLPSTCSNPTGTPTTPATPTGAGTTTPTVLDEPVQVPRRRIVYVERLSQSKSGRAFIKSCRDKFGFKVVEVYIIKWSDGCDPFNVKKNKVSHWILSMSFSPPDSKFYSTDNTYVIAAGPSNESHMPVVDKLREEFDAMAASVHGDLFYHATKKTFVHVSLGYLAVIQDSPERTGDNCVPAGNARLNARFGMSVDYQTLWEKILPCVTCKLQFLGNYNSNSTSIGCTKCTSWAIDPSQDLLAFRPMKDYPKDELPDNGFLPVLKFTFPKLLIAYGYSYQKLFTKQWKPQHYFAYLAYHGISNQTGEQVVLAVREKWNIQDILQSDKTKPEKNTLLLSIDKKEYLDYSDAQLEVYYSTPPPPPPTWVSGYSFDCLTPSVMHNLFLNVAKNIMKKVSELLKLFGLNEKFKAFANTATTKLAMVKCRWLPVIPWRFKGGYVSENWLALVHVIKYFTSGAVVLLRDYQYVEPTREKSKWNVDEKKKYLSVRGIRVKPKDPKRKDPLKADVDPVFFEEVNKPGGPSPLLIEPGFERKLTNVVASYGGVVSCVMIKKTEEGVTSKECEWRIKQFLTFVHDLQLSVEYFTAEKAPKKYEPVWVKQFSYLNLLNIPAALDRWGSMRNLWEGGVIGEGILRSVKPLAPRYAAHPFELLITRFYQARALTRAKLRHSIKPEEAFKGYEWMKEVMVYNDLEGVRVHYLAHDAMVVACFQKKTESECQSNKGFRFVILLHDRSVAGQAQDPEFPYVACAIRRTHFRAVIAACPYFDWLIDKYEVASIDTSKYVFTHSIVLCPAPQELLIPLSGNGKPYYSVTSEYEEIIRNGSVSRKGIYNDTPLFKNNN